LVPITFCAVGGGNEIGRSSYFLQVENHKMLLDCGIKVNAPLHYPDFDSLVYAGFLDGLWELDEVFLSHAHMDHSGAIPLLPTKGYAGPIYASKPTLSLASLMLQDAARHEGFSSSEVMAAFSQASPLPMNVPLQRKNLRATLFPAGHILGAAMLYLQTPAGNILFTGDFSDLDQLTVPGARLPRGLDVDFLIMENTYGGRSPDAHDNPGLPLYSFFEGVQQVLDDGGNVLIPSFSIGRAQEVALLLKSAVENQFLSFPPSKSKAVSSIFIDGLAIPVSEVYESFGVPVWDSLVRKLPRGQGVENLTSSIILASSGMLMPGTRSWRHAKALLSDPKNAIFFPGFLAKDSQGFQLLQAARAHDEVFRFGSDLVPLRARVDQVPLSAHVKHEGIVQFVSRLHPSTVVFVHGTDDAQRESILRWELKRKMEGEIEVIHAMNEVPVFMGRKLVAA